MFVNEANGTETMSTLYIRNLSTIYGDASQTTFQSLLSDLNFNACLGNAYASSGRFMKTTLLGLGVCFAMLVIALVF